MLKGKLKELNKKRKMEGLYWKKKKRGGESKAEGKIGEPEPLSFGAYLYFYVLPILPILKD